MNIKIWMAVKSYLTLVVIILFVGIAITPIVYSGKQLDENNNSVAISPLFAVRSQRAINYHQQVLSCEYIGKTKNKELIIEPCNKKTSFMRDIIERIRQMDDRTYQQFIELILVRSQNKFSNRFINKEIQNELLKIRENPEVLVQYQMIYSTAETPVVLSAPFGCGTAQIYCLILIVAILLLEVILTILDIFNVHLTFLC